MSNHKDQSNLLIGANQVSKENRFPSILYTKMEHKGLSSLVRLPTVDFPKN